MLKNLLLVGLGCVLTLAILGVAGFAWRKLLLHLPQTAPRARHDGRRGGMMRGFGGMMGGQRGEGGYGPCTNTWKSHAEALDMTEKSSKSSLLRARPCGSC